MKQLLLILAFLLPLCAYPQLKEPFNGLEITSDNPWTGDLDCFVIETGWLVSRCLLYTSKYCDITNDLSLCFW